MGLWFCNPYGRTAWYILMSSVLYTWELLAKFRRPIASQCNIYYRDTTSMARGPDQVAVVNDVAFRDCAWFIEEGAEQATGDPDFWFGVLSHINRDYCIKVVERFREFATDSHEFTQFTPVPMYTVTTKNRNVDVKPGVKDLNCQNWRLESAQNRWKPIKLGAVFDKGCNRFSLFYRYYVFCTTTGCDYLFYYGSTGPSQHRSLYPHIPQIEQRKLLSR